MNITEKLIQLRKSKGISQEELAEKLDGIEEIMRRINEEDTFAQREARKITFAELAERYGDAASERAFSIGDYESYLFNKHLEQKYSD